ncbi:protein kinase domain-containing protein [Pseudobacteriovorax antillogorgiicola]|uniref:histidine kinase n=1 Tax=Pseudobacteriovorax antillogorgiicola TaxID=1513793 RepID=A0A1Y6CEG3_9BACT|nr:AAA family ATPase [Pseudobacteriovorax antillogorgiicola]TCS47614.1 putative ATPase [Pseudobacteriovorax antillogorgiicola]SMF60059.1 Predicted ATPase [Pseudobacteriovorax antillogorgiicola]
MLKIEGFQFFEKIYEGSQSIVYRGHSDQGLPVVCKTPLLEYPSAEEIKSFEREFQVVMSLDHEGVIKPLDRVTFSNSIGIIMPDLGGSTLAKKISTKTLKLEDKISIVRQVTDALNHIHGRGIIHKDINPSNILVSNDLKATIIDFGISSQLASEKVEYSEVRDIEGTLHYLSPEQTGRMNRSVDLRSDLYSLGITMYEMFSGEKPFLGENLIELIHCHIAKSAIPLIQRNQDIPEPVSAIVEKLMNKDADDRYQTACGLLADLARLQEQLSAKKKLTAFELGQDDSKYRFEIPPKLYGREEEIEAVTLALDKAFQGASELLLVSGYSGSGKSALINETHRMMSHVDRYYCRGKYDQFNQNVPYSAFVEALSSLINQGILTGSDEELAKWRNRLTESLASNLDLIATIIPELRMVVDVKSVTGNNIKDSEKRFHFALLNLIQCVTENRPLILFLDDLQWADSSSINLIKVLLSDPDLKSVLLVGAYRSNEVDSLHPVSKLRESLMATGRAISELCLRELDTEDVCRLLVDTLDSDNESVRPLADILIQRTEGNPFYINQLLIALHEDDIIKFDNQNRKWIWDNMQIQQQSVTDDVVDLMLKKINRLSADGKSLLTLASCIGNRFDLETLIIIAESSFDKVYKTIWEAIDLGLVLPADQKYRSATEANASQVWFKFLHDRVQQAAYTLLLDHDRNLVHLKIGRLLANQLDENKNLFEVVKHLNKGRDLIDDRDERHRLTKLNHLAAKRSKLSAAYHSAVDFLLIAKELLGSTAWNRSYDDFLALNCELLEAFYLDAQYDEVHLLSKEIIQNAKRPLDTVDVYYIEPLAYVSESQPLEAIKLGLSGLVKLKLLPKEIKKDRFAILKALKTTGWAWKGKKIIDFVDHQELSDPKKDAIVKILGRLMSACYFADPKQLLVNTCLQVKIAIKDGNSIHSSKGYVTYGMILSRLGNLKDGYQFGKLAFQLAQKPDYDSIVVEITFLFNCFIRHSHEPLRDFVPSLEDNYRRGLETGEIEFAAHSLHNLSMLPFIYGENLNTLVKNMEKYTGIIQSKLHQITSRELNLPFWQAYLNLLGDCEDPFILKGKAYDENKMIPIYKEKKHNVCLYMTYLVKTIISYLLHDRKGARRNADLTKEYLTFLGHPNHLMFYFFDSLIYIDDIDNTPSKLIKKNLERQVRSNLKLLHHWAKTAPFNYMPKALIVEAELARVNKRYAKAEKLYEQSMDMAHENRFLLDEAIATELTSRFWREKGKAKIANMYLHDAYTLYQKWGSQSKLRQLESLPYEINWQKKTPHLTITNHRSTEKIGYASIDTSTVVTASHTIASETDLNEIIKHLMKLTLENAGAQEGYLILSEDGDLKLKSVARTGEEIHVESLDKSVKLVSYLPKSIINFVSRSGKHLVINNPADDSDFAHDPYILEHKPKSILCLPILFRTELVGVVYLENKLAIRAFTDRMVTVLSILATQGAISITNARHVENLKNMVENIQDLVDEKTRHISSVMRHIQQGIFTILPDMTVEEFYSDYLEAMFNEQDLSGKNPIDLLARSSLSSDEISRIETCLTNSFGEDSLSFEVNMSHFPREISMDSKIIELDWQNIVDELDNTEKVLVVARDVTAIRILEQETRQQKEDMLRIEEILAHPKEKVKNFFDESRKYLKTIQTTISNESLSEEDALRTISINYHTLKGLSRSQNFKSMVDKIHEAETFCSKIMNGTHTWSKARLSEDFETVSQALERYITLYTKKLGNTESIQTGIDRNTIVKALEIISSQPLERRLEAQDLERTLRSYCYTSSQVLFSELAAPIESLAKDLKKVTPIIEVSGPRIEFAPDTAQLLRGVLVHLIRNSLDHGIEPPELRTKVGKPAQGKIHVHLEVHDHGLSIHYHDDGSGLDIAKIKKLGVDRGLIEKSEHDNQRIANLICETGFSTSDTVSEISGRGIGMDAIKTAIEDSGGQFSLKLAKPSLDVNKNIPFEVIATIDGSKFVAENYRLKAV